MLTKPMEQANRLLLLVGSALAYVLAFPPFGWRPLALLSVAVLVGVAYEAGPRLAMTTGFLWGFTAFGTGLSWIWNIFGTFSLPLWGILALFPALFAWLVALAGSRLTGHLLVIFIALAWTGTEFLRCELMPLRFPWMNLGLALEPWPLASWVGVYGLGFLAALTVTSLIMRKWPMAVVTVLLLGMDALDAPVSSKEDTIPVAAIQAEDAATQTYIDLAASAPEARLLVWPEEAIPIDVRKVATIELAKVQAHAAKRNALVVFGTQTRLDGPWWQNTALTVDGVSVLGAHAKNHPVHFFNDGEPGATALPISTPLGRIGTPICFDCDFHDVVRRMTAAGAEYFAVPSMDPANWSVRQHIQHAQLFRVRAAENRRWIVVAASSGVSQIINADGRAVASLGAMQTGCLSGALERQTELSIYTRFGWLTPWVALSASVVWTVLLVFRVNPRCSRPAPR